MYRKNVDNNCCIVPTTLTTKLQPIEVIPDAKQSTCVAPVANALPLGLVQVDRSTAPSRPMNCGSGQCTARRRNGLFARRLTSAGQRTTSTVFSVHKQQQVNHLHHHSIHRGTYK